MDNKVIKLTSSGYKLNRPDYDAIYGVNDNTVFNTTLSPKRMLKNHYPMISAILKQQPLEKIYFQKASKNGNLRTILGGVEVAERNDVLSSEIGEPIALLEYANMKINAYTSFIKTFENFSKGGFMKVRTK